MNYYSEKKYTGIFLFSIVLYIVGIIVISVWNYNRNRENEIRNIDMQLKEAAAGIKYILSTDFHDRATVPGKISFQEDSANVKALTSYVKSTGMRFIYTFVEREGRIFFTSTSASDEEIESDKPVTYWFHFEEASEGVMKSFRENKTVYENAKDRWGHFRAIYLPQVSPAGNRYVAGAEYTMEYVDKILLYNLAISIIQGIFFLFLAIPLVLAYSRRQKFFFDKLSNLNIQLYEEISEKEKNIEARKKAENSLRSLNEDLEKRVAIRTAELEDSLRELNKTQDQLIQSEKLAAIGQTLSGMAHEMNTPLGIGITAASFLHDKTLELEKKYLSGKIMKKDFENYTEIAQECATSVLDNLKKTSGLLSNIKFMVAENHPGHKEVFSLTEEIRDETDRILAEYANTDCSVVINYEENIIVSSYPLIFRKIVFNLIMNSFIHGFNNTLQDFNLITIDIYPENENIMIEYMDNGDGVQTDNLQKIFEPFYTTRRDMGLTGLGLNIVYNFVTGKLNGTVEALISECGGLLLKIQVPFYELDYECSKEFMTVSFK